MTPDPPSAGWREVYAWCHVAPAYREGSEHEGCRVEVDRNESLRESLLLLVTSGNGRSERALRLIRSVDQEGGGRE